AGSGARGSQRGARATPRQAADPGRASKAPQCIALSMLTTKTCTGVLRDDVSEIPDGEVCGGFYGPRPGRLVELRASAPKPYGCDHGDSPNQASVRRPAPFFRAERRPG